MLRISLRLVGLNIYFYDVFLTIKWAQKRGIWKWWGFCISILMLRISLRLLGLNIYFYDVVF